MSGLFNDLWDLIFKPQPKKRRSISVTRLIWWVILLEAVTRPIINLVRKIKAVFTWKDEPKGPDPVDNIDPHSDK